MKNTITYTEWMYLQTRGPVDPGPDEPVEGTLLVGEKALDYYGNKNSYGEDHILIFPAFHNGERCWVKRETWCPGRGYSAQGCDETIISFQIGVEIFLTQGVFNFPTPEVLEAKK